MNSDPKTLAEFIERAGKLVVPSGAGGNTAAGIPDRRDAEGNWKHIRTEALKSTTEFDNRQGIRIERRQ